MDIVMEKWQEILEQVKTEYEVSDISFKTWLLPLKVHSVEGNMVHILVPSESGPVGLNIISKKYALQIKVVIAELTGHEYDIDFTLPGDMVSAEVPKETTEFDQICERANLNPKYTFDTFVVGKNNTFAHAASLAVAESPGEIYNPLFLYGGVGLGKTHLMHSIAHFILQKNPSARIRYATSEEFTNELIDAIRNGNNTAMSKFREKYRNIDVLLIDDVQFIIGKESTQEEFFHTFNTLQASNKQIILSSDRPPKDMEILEDRIRSRFEWGLLADIQPPDYETRMAILRKKEELDGYNIDDKIIEYANLEKREINMELAEKVLKDIISPNQQRIVTPEFIITTVAEHFDLTSEEITGSKRSSKVVLPRQIAMFLCREMTNVPLKGIGKYLGNRDHTTIMHGIEKIEKELQTSDSLQNTVSILKKKINPSP